MRGNTNYGFSSSFMSFRVGWRSMSASLPKRKQ
jgi:hypothetical protein